MHPVTLPELSHRTIGGAHSDEKGGRSRRMRMRRGRRERRVEEGEEGEERSEGGEKRWKVEWEEGKG